MEPVQCGRDRRINFGCAQAGRTIQTKRIVRIPGLQAKLFADLITHIKEITVIGSQPAIRIGHLAPDHNRTFVHVVSGNGRRIAGRLERAGKLGGCQPVANAAVAERHANRAIYPIAGGFPSSDLKIRFIASFRAYFWRI